MDDIEDDEIEKNMARIESAEIWAAAARSVASMHEAGKSVDEIVENLFLRRDALLSDDEQELEGIF